MGFRLLLCYVSGLISGLSLTTRDVNFKSICWSNWRIVPPHSFVANMTRTFGAVGCACCPTTPCSSPPLHRCAWRSVPCVLETFRQCFYAPLRIRAASNAGLQP